MHVSSIHDSWKNVLGSAIESKEFLDLMVRIDGERANWNIYPPEGLVFRAFQLTPFEEVKVVILGQDPYHSFGQAHGLAFSVPDGVRIPPSLKNIFKELNADLGIPIPSTGNLTSWAEQGVLLLNSALTVKEQSPGSHHKIGWEPFTDLCIKMLSEQRHHLVFLLWGNFARAKKHLIDSSKHLVLEASHPSPLSAYSGFFGCRHFSATNNYLENKDQSPVDWMLD